jgi:CheY-like chemotaxis protein
LRYVLEMSGCLVVEASDGEEAVRLATRTLPHLILMDTTLPELDGYSATERIRNLESDRKATIIFLSGHAGPQARDKALAAGGDDYFLKPIDLRKLELALTKYLTIPTSSAG